MRVDARAGLFWAGALVLLGFRLFLSADLSVQISYSPHDDSLYVERAYHLLRGEGFGPYDSRILVKYPGISLWLAATRSLQVPFLFSVNALYVIAGFYMAWALLRAHANRWVVLGAVALYLLNPITFGYEWIRALREPLGTGLFILILAAMAHIFVATEQNRGGWWHLLVLAPAFAFALFLREDDRLLWGLLLLFGAALGWQVLSRPGRKGIVFLWAAVLLPAATGKAYEYGLRAFVERHYGFPIVHELGEGGYPRLLAAIRSIQSAKDNRMVMVTQEALGKLREEVPSFRPVIERLPSPGPSTFSCRLHGVCTEWSNGWMPYWIRDEAYRAGLTPTLPAAQDYFRKVADTIWQACQSHRLPCVAKGDGLIPPMELRWTRAYVVEAWRLFKYVLAPHPNTVAEAPRAYAVSPELARMYHEVTMTPQFATAPQDSLSATSLQGAWRTRLATPFQLAAAILLIGASIALGVRLWNADRRPLGAVALAGSVFGLYSLVRLAVLAYVAVYMGAFDPRMVFSSYAAAVILALPFIADVLLRRKESGTST